MKESKNFIFKKNKKFTSDRASKGVAVASRSTTFDPDASFSAAAAADFGCLIVLVGDDEVSDVVDCVLIDEESDDLKDDDDLDNDKEDDEDDDDEDEEANNGWRVVVDLDIDEVDDGDDDDWCVVVDKNVDGDGVFGVVVT